MRPQPILVENDGVRKMLVLRQGADESSDGRRVGGDSGADHRGISRGEEKMSRRWFARRRPVTKLALDGTKELYVRADAWQVRNFSFPGGAGECTAARLRLASLEPALRQLDL